MSNLQLNHTAFIKNIDRILTNNLSVIGEEVVNLAREKKNYTDRTGNLISSTGYCIYKYGNRIKENFEANPSVPTEPTGDEEGRQIADEAANSGDLVLSIVAGMEYAQNVEDKGYLVLSAFVPSQAKMEKRIIDLLPK